MSRTLFRSLLVFAPVFIVSTTVAFAHDCKSYTRTSSTATGWMIEGELVPFDEAMPVAPPDGQLTICRRPDGTRRCVFGLKPGL